MNAIKIAKAITDENIGHVLIHYASSVRHLIRRNKDGSFKKRNGATKIFVAILESVDDEQVKRFMLDEINAPE